MGATSYYPSKGGGGGCLTVVMGTLQLRTAMILNKTFFDICRYTRNVFDIRIPTGGDKKLGFMTHPFKSDSTLFCLMNP